MPRYAQNTSVSREQSVQEIERTLTRYGADQFAYGWSGVDATIGFSIPLPQGSRMFRFRLTMPDPESREFAYTPTRRTRRSKQQQQKEWEQACRQRWRALALVIKAKLEAVESGITDFESEFLSYAMLPNGRTVGEEIQPKLIDAYDTGQMPELMPGEGWRALPESTT